MPEKRMRKTRLYDRDQTIALVNPENPRRNGSNRAAIFDIIRDGMTVDEFLHAVLELKGGTKDLQILEQSGHLEVLPTEDASQEQEAHTSY
jgi:hypothetical protein|tara:strand:+ start:223 stop:495 length:273 start_codon:yes stop_codon:yes gene_type:complete